jgi:hypothetical protein
MVRWAMTRPESTEPRKRTQRSFPVGNIRDGTGPAPRRQSGHLKAAQCARGRGDNFGTGPRPHCTARKPANAKPRRPATTTVTRNKSCHRVNRSRTWPSIYAARALRRNDRLGRHDMQRSLYAARDACVVRSDEAIRFATATRPPPLRSCRAETPDKTPSRLYRRQSRAPCVLAASFRRPQRLVG